MLRIVGHDVVPSLPVELSFNDPSGWPTPLGVSAVPGAGQRLTTVLIGDETDGPSIGLSYVPPREEAPPRGPAHGHDSDTWRMLLKGHMSMGSRTFRPGEFRFQQGGVPYGSDDLGWGPDGGWSVVVFADRQLFTMRPVKRDLQPDCDANAERFATWAGITLPKDRRPVVAGVSTELGSPSKGGNVDGTFDETETWPELGPGIRAAVGLFGDPRTGPIMTTSRLDPGAELGGERFDTEVFHLVVDGSCQFGDRWLADGDIWIQPSGTAHPSIVAGSEGCSQFMLFADRSRLGSAFQREWVTSVVSVVGELQAALTPDAA